MSELTGKLEDLIESQAMGQAEQHLQSGQQAAEQIRQALRDRLHLLETAEEPRFQQEAGQRCRQLLQGAKLRFDADIDRLRWALVQDVLSGVRTRLENLPTEPARYRAALVRFIAEAAAAIPAASLVAELTVRDVEWLRPDWAQLAEQAAPGREIALRVLDELAAGGVRVSDAAGTVRMDNTFEGRMARMENNLLSAIMEALFVGDEIWSSVGNEIWSSAGESA